MNGVIARNGTQKIEQHDKPRGGGRQAIDAPEVLNTVRVVTQRGKEFSGAIEGGASEPVDGARGGFEESACECNEFSGFAEEMDETDAFGFALGGAAFAGAARRKDDTIGYTQLGIKIRQGGGCQEAEAHRCNVLGV